MLSGSEAKAIELYTNYFEVVNKPNWALYQYRVDFEPFIESKRLRIALTKQHSDSLFMGKDAFDGQDLFSIIELEKEVTYFGDHFLKWQIPNTKFHFDDS
jgi:aubergine-like protein